MLSVPSEIKHTHRRRSVVLEKYSIPDNQNQVSQLVGLCSQQGVRCCLALECAFSRQPVPGGGKDPRWAPPAASPASRSPPGQPNHFISIFPTSTYQPFPNRKEENDVFIVLPLPKWHLTLSRQFLKEPLFRALLCSEWRKGKCFQKVLLWFYENV